MLAVTRNQHDFVCTWFLESFPAFMIRTRRKPSFIVARPISAGASQAGPSSESLQALEAQMGQKDGSPYMPQNAQEGAPQKGCPNFGKFPDCSCMTANFQRCRGGCDQISALTLPRSYGYERAWGLGVRDEGLEFRV